MKCKTYEIIVFVMTLATRKSFFEKRFFRTGLYPFPSSKYKTSIDYNRKSLGKGVGRVVVKVGCGEEACCCHIRMCTTNHKITNSMTIFINRVYALNEKTQCQI